ncbi:MAG: TolC family protein [Thermoanaerobaculia bacterium]
MISKRYRRICLRGIAGILLLLLSASGRSVLAEESKLLKPATVQPSGAGLLTGYPSEERDPGSPDLVEPGEELTLARALALALLRSPDLAEYAWGIRAQEARVLQAGLLPNPVLSALVENLGTGRDDITGGIQKTIQLGQLVELGGKRSARRRVAARKLDLAEWAYEIERLNLLSRVSKSFIELLSKQRRVVLTEEIVRLTEKSAAAVSGRVAAGKVSPVEETKANVALSSARIGLDRSRRELEASRRALSESWGNPDPTFKSAVGDFDSILPIPALEGLMELFAQNPVLSLSAAEVSFREAAVDLAKASRVPDLTVGAGVRRYEVSGEQTDAIVVGISLPLPLFDRKQGEIPAARSDLKRAAESRRATEVRLRVALAEGYQLLSSAYSEVTALRSTVLPGAQSAFDAVNEGYRLGRFGLLDVLDSQRTLFEARRQYLRAAEDYHKTVVDVERLIGDRLDSTESTQDGDLP